MKHPAYFETDEKTSKRMSKVKLKRGDAEKRIAKLLWHKGYRYRLNYKGLPGSPDIAIQRYKIAVFIDGEFWHGKDWEKRKSRLKRNRDYWIEKIEENIARDSIVDKKLKAAGWIPIRFWSKEALNNAEECIRAIDEYVFENEIL